MNEKLKSLLIKELNSSRIDDIELIQELWSGYGSLSRVTLDTGPVILKLIDYNNIQNHPRGWSSDISHQRKVKSYLIEKNWYQQYNQQVADSYSPRLIASGEIDGLQYLIIEDLKELGFIPKNKINLKEIKTSLRWLAHFHANYMHSDTTKLWRVGTYWHLETRPDELKAIKDSQLRDAAPLIDKKLSSSMYQTIVHGDAKLANFLYKNEDFCSAVDFQYVGGGVGVKDVAYFLSSVYEEDELYKNEQVCLDYYFQELKIALTNNGLKDNVQQIEEEWRELYPFAWCDFFRFLQGWSPEHYKINSYSKNITRKVLECI